MTTTSGTWRDQILADAGSYPDGYVSPDCVWSDRGLAMLEAWMLEEGTIDQLFRIAMVERANGFIKLDTDNPQNWGLLLMYVEPSELDADLYDGIEQAATGALDGDALVELRNRLDPAYFIPMSDRYVHEVWRPFSAEAKRAWREVMAAAQPSADAAAQPYADVAGQPSAGENLYNTGVDDNPYNTGVAEDAYNTGVAENPYQNVRDENPYQNTTQPPIAATAAAPEGAYQNGAAEDAYQNGASDDAYQNGATNDAPVGAAPTAPAPPFGEVVDLARVAQVNKHVLKSTDLHSSAQYWVVDGVLVIGERDQDADVYSAIRRRPSYTGWIIMSKKGRFTDPGQVTVTGCDDRTEFSQLFADVSQKRIHFQ